jgi:hypothetical protein
MMALSLEIQPEATNIVTSVPDHTFRILCKLADLFIPFSPIQVRSKRRMLYIESLDDYVE